jgi:hypothetical protein
MVLLANWPTPEQQIVVTTLIQANGASWWHWFPTVWIISDPLQHDLLFWTQTLRLASPQFVFLLIDLDDPSRPPIGYMNPEWYEWIRQHWPS